MDASKWSESIEKAKVFFKNEIAAVHLKNVAKSGSLKQYKVNPLLKDYLAYFLRGDNSAKSIAEALILPRVLGASINTSFGSSSQRMITEIFEGLGSTTSGIDIEFVDAIDGRKKYCQVKAGPSTINHDDVKTIKDHFKMAKNLARQNKLSIGFDDFIVGVLYGKTSELNTNYTSIRREYPVLVGQEFWHHLTGKPDYYQDLIQAFGEVAQAVDGREVLEAAIAQLTAEIERELKIV